MPSPEALQALRRLRDPAYRIAVSKEVLQRDIRLLWELPASDILDLLVTLSRELNALVEDIPGLVLDGLEARLPEDEPSRLAAEAVLARISRPLGG